MPKVIIRQTTPPDGTVNINKSDGVLISAVTVASGGTEPYNVADSTAVLKDTDGTIISTTPIKATESEDIVAPDTDLEINGTPEGSFTAGSTIDLQLTDGVNPVTPVSVGRVGDTVTATLPAASTGWVRNPDWLPLPVLASSDDRFVGLFIVFENGYNLNSMQVTGVGTIDWGDGTVVAANNTVQSHVYDYSTITSPVKQYYDGRNYKQVIVDVLSTSISNILLERNTGVNNGGNINYVDINFSLNVPFVISANQRQMRILERLNLVKMPNLSAVTGGRLQNLVSVRELFIDYTKFINTALGGLGLIDLGNVNIINATGSALMFEGGYMRSIGDVDVSTSTDCARMFRLCIFLEGTGVVNVNSCANITTMFQQCSNIRKITLINCGNITTTTNAFNLCTNLEELELFGMTVGFSVNGCRMTAQSLNVLMTSLDTANGSQNLDFRNNPGAATCDTTIATGKGYTVQIA